MVSRLDYVWPLLSRYSVMLILCPTAITHCQVLRLCPAKFLVAYAPLIDFGYSMFEKTAWNKCIKVMGYAESSVCFTLRFSEQYVVDKVSTECLAIEV